MTIIRAKQENIDALVPLFDGYIRFYKGASDTGRFRSFLDQRIQKEEAIIFLALSEGREAMGFTLLYPSFSSVSQARIFVLNDLFVAPLFRKKGVAKALMEYAANYGRSMGGIRLHLETQEENIKAQQLYESTGWILEKGYYHYNLPL